MCRQVEVAEDGFTVLLMQHGFPLQHQQGRVLQEGTSPAHTAKMAMRCPTRYGHTFVGMCHACKKPCGTSST